MSAYHWWARRFFEPAERLSILDLVNSGTLNLRLASVLWLMMERRASVLVVAGPNMAGKSTLLNALLDFLPPEVKQVDLDGMYEDFEFVEHSVPNKTYMVAPEINWYGFYLWGKEARRAFELLSQGYAFGSTMHARTVEETVGILHYDLGLPLSLIVNINAIITLRMIGSWMSTTEPKRLVDAVGIISPGKNGLSVEFIASRSSTDRELYCASDGQLSTALARKFEIKYKKIAPEIKLREQFLDNLLTNNVHSHRKVREAIVGFYRGRPY
jgi:energy-coupling factor transporter ATP-binding protein EcfA2